MDKLSIGEKAKRYDEAIEQLRTMMPNWENLSYNGKTFLQDLVHILPELKESKESGDEKIRKELIDYFKENNAALAFKGISNERVIAWLEKQGENASDKIVEKSRTEKQRVLLTETNGNANIDWDARSIQDVKLLLEYGLGYIKKLEKQGEPADLKTKAGNWYVCDMEVMNENMVTAFRRGEIYHCPKDGYLDVHGALFEVGCLDVFRLATEKEIPQTKQEWSEEDKSLCSQIQGILSVCKSEDLLSSDLHKEMCDWLKSLKERYTWKPSEEQMKALYDSIPEMVMVISEREMLLNSLYKDLKKLMKE